MSQATDSLGTDDPYHLSRFLHAQQDDFPRALAEIRAGRKRTHWMWYIFPQIDGLAVSATSKHYAIKSIDEARAYLAHPVLGPDCWSAPRRSSASRADRPRQSSAVPTT